MGKIILSHDSTAAVKQELKKPEYSILINEFVKTEERKFDDDVIITLHLTQSSGIVERATPKSSVSEDKKIIKLHYNLLGDYDNKRSVMKNYEAPEKVIQQLTYVFDNLRKSIEE